MKKIITIICLLLATAAQANSIADWFAVHGGYVGFGFGHGSTVAANQPAHQSIDVNRKQDSTTGTVFAGLRNSLVGIETGYMYLPEYHATASTSNYPAYKGCTLGPQCPKTASITQDIYSRALYLRGNLYAPQFGAFTAYGFAGRAWVQNYNHEYGDYDGTDKVDFKVSFMNVATLYGLGLQVQLDGKWSGRLEYTRIPSATVEEHTLDRTVEMATLNLVRRF